MIRRRDFLSGVTLAATLGVRRRSAAAEPPLETTKIRVARSGGICIAPVYLAEDFLRMEGFTDVEYVRVEPGAPNARAMSVGQVDIGLNFAPPLVVPIDAREPLVVLAGIHVGCFELFANERIRAVRDLKGKTVGVEGLGSSPHLFVASILTHVGLDPHNDIKWLTAPSKQPMRLFAEGKIDAFLGFAPEPQELRAMKIGRVLVNSGVDRPWSQYFCCLAAGNAQFVREHPVATKRAVRALLKATDLCASEPDRVARIIVDRGAAPSYDYARQTITELNYRRWREYDPADTVRFYALRLHEARIIKSAPQRIIDRGTDWRFLNELRRELKA